MRNKEKVMYYVVILGIFALLTVVLLHNMSRTHTYNQQYIESKLPARLQQESETNPVIRVLIKTNGFQEITHTKVELSARQGLTVTAGETILEYGPNEVFLVQPDNELFRNGSIRVEAKDTTGKITVSSLNRGYGTPSYRGSFELFSTAEGIALVNELLMEEYLCSVVPSEMPASYEMEALKVQAICARSYAYCQTRELSYPEYNAHVDDSTLFQVYGNSREQESTIQAVNETAGRKLWHQGQVVKTYFYSTSCGHSTSIEAWGSALTEENQYLKGVAICDENGNAYEKDLAWFKWTAEIPALTLQNLLELNTGMKIGTLQSVSITKRGVGNVALELVATGTENTITVQTENDIRSALGGSGVKITRQDGSTISSSSLLPSAFFTIEKNGDKYIIKGGGYGHGIGMSQNGANEMAKAGKTYEEILTFFYPGTKVE
ncbi:MAG: SpoIID/LytB domain-containing protein [Tyzzerella sp.]|nr:SpoIID/LytB domain-containing protein [Tyzzerella sp.]